MRDLRLLYLLIVDCYPSVPQLQCFSNDLILGLVKMQNRFFNSDWIPCKLQLLNLLNEICLF